jgi:hypothetical protein
MRKYKKIKRINLTNVRKQNAVFVKYVNVPTDCIGSRNTSCRGAGLKVTMNRKSREVPDGPRGNVQTNRIEYGRASNVTFKSINEKNSVKMPPPYVDRKEIQSI